MTDNPEVIKDQLLKQAIAVNESLRAALPTQEGGKQKEGLAARLEKLESRLDNLRADHSKIDSKVSVLEERIAHLPTKPDLWKALAAVFAGLATVIAFGEKIQNWIN